MVEPLTIALASWLGSQAATAFGGIIGNASDRVFVDKTRAVQKALTSGLAEPRNHDLARAIRCSQLLALQLTIKAYERLEQPRFLQRARQSSPGFSPEAITVPLSEWIRQSVINQATLDFDPTALTEEAAKQWTARVDQIQAKIDRAFTHPEPGEGAAFERLNQLRRLSEDWVVDEAKSKVGNLTDWTRFENVIRKGHGAFSGWWPAFRAYLAEEIKNDPRVHAILVQQNIAHILGLHVELRDAVTSLQTGFEAFLNETRGALVDLRAASDGLQQAAQRAEQAFGAFDQNAGQILDVVLAIQQDVADLKTRGEDANAPDLDPPPETQDSQTLSEFKSLYFGARFDAFIGRQADLDFLDAFLHAPAPFAWQIIYGEGGVGKSRLALDKMLKLSDDWDKGFLLQSSLGLKQIRQWRPRRHRFIIIDYAATYTATVGKFLVDLQATAPHFGGQRVRVLLIERRADEEWLRRLKAAEHWTLVDPLEHQPPKEIVSLSDDELLELMRARLEKRGRRSDLSPTQWLDKLAEVDRNKRPLFGAILAEAYADGQTLEKITRENLLTETLTRERNHFWLSPEEKTGVLTADYVAHAQFLALATMINGLTLSDHRALPQDALFLPDPDPRKSCVLELERLRRMTRVSGEDDDDPIFHALAPDLLGELFVLKRLLGDDARNIRTQHTRQPLIDAAWTLNGAEMARFVIRCAQDYPKRLQALHFLQPSGHLEEPRVWFSMAQVGMIEGENDLDFERDIHQRVRRLQTGYPNDAAVRENAANGAYNLLTVEGKAGNLTEARGRMDYLKTLQTGYPKDAAVREKAAMGAFNLITFEGNAGNLTEARGRMAYLQTLQTGSPVDATVREQAAMGAANLLTFEGKAGNLTEARGRMDYLQTLQTLQTGSPDDAAVRKQAAMGAVNLSCDEGKAGNLPEARVLMAYLQTLQTGSPDDAAVRELAAIGAVNLITLEDKAGNLTEARGRMAYLQTLQTAYDEDEVVRQIAGDGAAKIIIFEVQADDGKASAELWRYIQTLGLLEVLGCPFQAFIEAIEPELKTRGWIS